MLWSIAGVLLAALLAVTGLVLLAIVGLAALAAATETGREDRE